MHLFLGNISPTVREILCFLKGKHKQIGKSKAFVSHHFSGMFFIKTGAGNRISYYGEAYAFVKGSCSFLDCKKRTGWIPRKGGGR